MLSPEEYHDLQIRMQSLEDGNLLRIVLLNRDEYSADSLAIVEEEIRKRNLDNVTLDEFSKKFPEEYYPFVSAFCPACLNETIDEQVGFLFSLYGIGVSLTGRRFECAICCSVVRTKWISFILPIYRIGQYRVKYLDDPAFMRGEFISRRLKMNLKNTAD